MAIQRMRVREVVLQLLYQHEKNPTIPRQAIEEFVRDRLNNPELAQQALELYDAVLARRGEIDAHISRAAHNWRLHRMISTDRNALRIATCQLLAQSAKTPENLSVAKFIDEALNLACRFGTADSMAFVNGVLDRIAKDLAVPLANLQPLARVSATEPASKSGRSRNSTFFPRPSTLKRFRKKKRND